VSLFLKVMYLLIASIIAVVIIASLLFLLVFKKRKKHWQQGYIMVGNFKQDKSTQNKHQEDYPLYQPPQEEKQEGVDIIMPPGMFD
jgi:hypothetical protein